jgi:hypothetical protein
VLLACMRPDGHLAGTPSWCLLLKWGWGASLRILVALARHGMSCHAVLHPVTNKSTVPDIRSFAALSHRPQGGHLVAGLHRAGDADCQAPLARCGEPVCGHMDRRQQLHVSRNAVEAGPEGLDFWGGVLQVDTFTAERYSPHRMDCVDTPARRPAARPANKTSPNILSAGRLLLLLFDSGTSCLMVSSGPQPCLQQCLLLMQIHSLTTSALCVRLLLQGSASAARLVCGSQRLP